MGIKGIRHGCPGDHALELQMSEYAHLLAPLVEAAESSAWIPYGFRLRVLPFFDLPRVSADLLPMLPACAYLLDFTEDQHFHPVMHTPLEASPQELRHHA